MMRSATKKRTGRDPARLKWIRSLPCVCCFAFMHAWNFTEYWKRRDAAHRYSEAAHVGERGLSQKCSDAETIPLCGEHHRTRKYSAHRLGKNFWAHWGIDKQKLLAELQTAYESSIESSKTERHN